jgi:hypothetical protein
LLVYVIFFRVEEQTYGWLFAAFLEDRGWQFYDTSINAIELIDESLVGDLLE